MKIKEVGLIGGNTARTKAYLQVLLSNNLEINKCYIMSCNIDSMEKESKQYQKNESNEETYFSVNEPLLYTLRKYNLPYEIIASEDINSKIVMDKIKQIEENYLIYSGFGGQILKAPLFETGKKFIHVHAGILPQYRGSTTVYYSMINEKKCGASAIFLNEKIDEGDVIACEEFPIPLDGTNIDYIYEPWTRAKVLQRALEDYVNNGSFKTTKQTGGNENTYYIIHPVLKHIALMQK
jgi:methionyl-tRNA formyltransferase